MTGLDFLTFKQLSDKLPVGVEILELISKEEMDFRLLYVNDSRSRISGVDMTSFVGQNTRSIYAPAYEGGAAFPRAMMTALETRADVPMGIETYVDERQGAKVYDVTCVYLGDNRVSFIFKSAEEVTSLTQQLSLRKQMFEKAEKHTHKCTWAINYTNQTFQYTPNYAQIYHVDPQEIIDRSNQVLISYLKGLIASRVSSVDEQKLETLMSQPSETYPQSEVIQYQYAPAKLAYLEIIVVQKLEDGTIIGVTRDITDSHKREIELKQALHFQEKVMSTSPEIIYVYDLLEQQNLFASRSLFADLGYTEADVQEMGNQLLVNTIHPEDLEKVFHHHANVLPNLQDGNVVKLEYRMKHKASAKYDWLESTEGVFEHGTNGKVRTIIGIARNVDARKKAELELADTNQELEQFVYSVSHDLRAPVRHIHSYSEIIQKMDGDKLSEKSDKSLNRVLIASERLGEMIDQLLAYSRTRNAQPTKLLLPVEVLVRGIMEEFTQTYAEKPISYTLDSLPNCYADKFMFVQIWENLISNAIKYSSKKPDIMIRIEGVENEKEIIYSVHDNGCGFDARFANKLFTVFQRLHKKSDYPGHGIGLANVARMIKHHGGRVWAESVLGEGASFYFSIPKLRLGVYESAQESHTR